MQIIGSAYFVIAIFSFKIVKVGAKYQLVADSR